MIILVINISSEVIMIINLVVITDKVISYSNKLLLYKLFISK